MTRPIFSEAVRYFWSTRDGQAAQIAMKGGIDQGGRSAVVAGKQMDGFVSTLLAVLRKSGVPDWDIYCARDRELPGFFRPTKDWDIAIVSQGHLRAAIELKSQVGPSFGNNFNNRTEEALGNAVDLWTAYREGAFRTSPRPWVGYLFLLEDCAKSKAPVKVREPHFGVFPEFQRASYATRYELLCRKLVRERHYDGACFLLSDRTQWQVDINYSEPADDLSAALFIEQLVRHVAP
jgi:hypothetical protein